MLSPEKAKSQTLTLCWWEMYELEKGIAVSWLSCVGFSQQSDCGDLLLLRSYIMFSTNLQWKRFHAYSWLYYSVLPIDSDPSLYGSLFEIVFQYPGKYVYCGLHLLIL